MQFILKKIMRSRLTLFTFVLQVLWFYGCYRPFNYDSGGMLDFSIPVLAQQSADRTSAEAATVMDDGLAAFA